MNVCLSRTPPGPAGPDAASPPSPLLLSPVLRVLCSRKRRSCIRGMRPRVLACPSPPAAMVRAVSSAVVGMSVLLLLLAAAERCGGGECISAVE